MVVENGSCQCTSLDAIFHCLEKEREFERTTGSQALSRKCAPIVFCLSFAGSVQLLFAVSFLLGLGNKVQACFAFINLQRAFNFFGAHVCAFEVYYEECIRSFIGSVGSTSYCV